MPLSLNNSKDIVANSISVLKGNRTIDVLETIDAVTGLAPATLNSLEKLAKALNDDAGFFTTVKDALDDKAPLESPTFTGLINVSHASDHVTHSITNTQLNGFSSVYFNTKSGASVNEVGQIFCGQTGGLHLRTNTAHPIKFTTYNNAATQLVSILPSMQILANSTRDVEILAPLKVKCPTTTIDNDLTVGGDLLIGTTNVMTALGDKAATSALSNYALTSSLSNYALTSSLSNYALTTALSNYALTTALSNYVLTSSLSSYVNSTALTTALTPY
jgi:hypothetical protein